MMAEQNGSIREMKKGMMAEQNGSIREMKKRNKLKGSFMFFV